MISDHSNTLSTTDVSAITTTGSSNSRNIYISNIITPLPEHEHEHEHEHENNNNHISISNAELLSTRTTTRTTTTSSSSSITATSRSTINHTPINTVVTKCVDVSPSIRTHEMKSSKISSKNYREHNFSNETTKSKQTSLPVKSSNATNIIILKISKILLVSDLELKKRPFQHYVNFLQDVLKRSKTTKTCLILAVYYYNKLVHQNENNTTKAYCSKRGFYGCLILAHKYLNDKTFNIESWSIISGEGGLLKSEITTIERWCLQKLSYDLYVKDINVLQKWCIDKLLHV